MGTYRIDNMRFVQPSGKTAERNPDRFGTVYGEFHSEDGKTQLSITSKTISKDEAKNPATVIDLTNGILTLEDGRRGRTASKGLSQTDIEAQLKLLRK